jgi:hypothetical protein
LASTSASLIGRCGVSRPARKYSEKVRPSRMSIVTVAAATDHTGILDHRDPGAERAYYGLGGAFILVLRETGAPWRNTVARCAAG